ncbi:hypothetical protein BHE74_00003683 [Ensete ventricosum]|nr:hypothetical protein BHE74_00003683 [Ensete ventricosum]
MSQERQELLGNPRGPLGEGTHVLNLSPSFGRPIPIPILHGREHFFPNPKQILEIVQRPRALAPWWGSRIVGRLSGSFSSTCATDPDIDGNDPDRHPSHSSSVFCPSACLTDPFVASPAPSTRPASSASNASDTSPLVFPESPAPEQPIRCGR